MKMDYLAFDMNWNFYQGSRLYRVEVAHHYHAQYECSILHSERLYLHQGRSYSHLHILMLIDYYLVHKKDSHLLLNNT